MISRARTRQNSAPSHVGTLGWHVTSTTPFATMIAIVISLLCGVGVAKAECFASTIVLPPVPEFGDAFFGQVPVTWCSEVNGDTGQLEITSFETPSCSGGGDSYVGCTAPVHDASASSFAVSAEWVFCPLLAGGGCLWVVIDDDVQFDASGAVTTLSRQVRTAPSGPPHL